MEKEKLVQKLISDIVVLSSFEQLSIAAQFTNTFIEKLELTAADKKAIHSAFIETHNRVQSKQTQYSVNLKIYIDLAFEPISSQTATPVIESCANPVNQD